jgi:O-methyltransferase/methyltransferase family protein
MSTPPSADRVEQVSFGFMASKVLFSAIEFGLFTELAKESMDAAEIQKRCGLHPRGVRDFLDTLVALRMLERRGEIYSNTSETDFYLDRAKFTYIGHYIEIQSLRGYQLFDKVSEALRTGEPQNEIKSGDEDWVDAMYRTPERLRFFLRGMTGHSLPSAMAIARKFPWEKYRTFADVGTAEGCLPVQVAMVHPHLVGEGFDLPAVRPFFDEYVASFHLQDRVKFRVGDFFKEPLPAADVLVMGMILHDWNLDVKMALLKKAYDALPRGGALIVYDHLIDDERRKNVAGLLMSLIMLVETQGGFDYTGADCCKWMREAGFSETRVEQLTGIESMVVGIK